jgi:hypothetical protein
LVAQNIADDFWMCASVNLPGRVAVPKYVATDLSGSMTCTSSVETDPMAQRASRELPMGHCSGDEDLAGYGVSRTATSQVSCKGPGNGRQKR